MSIKLLAFDLDGTLLRPDKSVDPRVKEAIARAQQEGIAIALASGRDKNGCAFVYEDLGLDQGNNYLVLVNGQIQYDFAAKEYDLDDVLLPEDGLKIQDVCRKYGVEGIFCCGYDFYSYLSQENRRQKEEEKKKSGEPMDYGLKSASDKRNFIELDVQPYTFEQDINKVCLVHTPAFFQDNLENLRNDLPDYDLMLVGPGWLEIMPKGIGKASGLRKIAQKNGYTMNEVMAFGDAENDLHMLEEAGIGVAMGNGMDTVKKTANIVTDTNVNGGIAKAINALLDGKEEQLRNGTLDLVHEPLRPLQPEEMPAH